MLHISCSLVCSKLNLTFVPKDNWWVNFGSITHISVSIQDCVCWLPNNDERFVFVGNGERVAGEAIGTFKLHLKNEFYLDLFETFVEPLFRHNLISIPSLYKFGFCCSLGNNKVSLYQNSNLIGFGSLIDNLHMLVVICSTWYKIKIKWEFSHLMEQTLRSYLQIENSETCVGWNYWTFRFIRLWSLCWMHKGKMNKHEEIRCRKS